MNHPDLDLMIHSERRKDEMAAAEQHRLLKAAGLTAKSSRLHLIPQAPLRPLVALLARGMARLGVLLTTWSCRLQQYTAVPVLGEPAEEQPVPCSG
jgi:hypothetical protein